MIGSSSGNCREHDVIRPGNEKSIVRFPYTTGFLKEFVISGRQIVIGVAGIK